MLPFAPGAAREILRTDEQIVEGIGNDPALITTRELPDPLRGPAMTIRAGVNRRENASLSKIRLLISVWVPKAELLVDLAPPVLTDPEELSWNLAVRAAEVLDMKRLMGRGELFTFRGQQWRGQWDGGPTTMVDLERGPENPLYRSVIEVVMKMGS
ncbi:tail terminator [Gordonia phage Nyceirae]|uniref:Tail terminator n=1 Tax=Gordonia phage Nyceirae TaxID=1887651 RepID=A0A1C9EI09_9CAUD|nr:tail terminator [Gordonia phage Nyceirae]AON97380.1 tail terminator [Gordonia phage Nyceirae]